MKRQLTLLSLALLSLACTDSDRVVEGERKSQLADADIVTSLADLYYATTLEQTPEVAYFSGVELDRHDGMEDNSPEARQAAQRSIDKMLNKLQRVDAAPLAGRSEWITHAYLLQQLTASVSQRICRNELWNVNQMGGWHSGYSQIAQL